MGAGYSLCGEQKITSGIKFSALYSFHGLQKRQVDIVYSGDIIALAGVENIQMGATISALENPLP